MEIASFVLAFPLVVIGVLRIATAVVSGMKGPMLTRRCVSGAFFFLLAGVVMTTLSPGGVNVASVSMSVVSATFNFFDAHPLLTEITYLTLIGATIYAAIKAHRVGDHKTGGGIDGAALFLVVLLVFGFL